MTKIKSKLIIRHIHINTYKSIRPDNFIRTKTIFSTPKIVTDARRILIGHDC